MGRVIGYEIECATCRSRTKVWVPDTGTWCGNCGAPSTPVVVPDGDGPPPPLTVILCWCPGCGRVSERHAGAHLRDGDLCPGELQTLTYRLEWKD